MQKIKLFTLVFATAFLAGTAFAGQKTNAKATAMKANQALLDKSLSDSRVTKPAATSDPALNQNLLALGGDFVIAIRDAEDIVPDDEESTYAAVILDLVYLIDSLEGQREAAKLQSILRKAVRETASGGQLAAEIKTVFNGPVLRWEGISQGIHRPFLETQRVGQADRVIRNVRILILSSRFPQRVAGDESSQRGRVIAIAVIVKPRSIVLAAGVLERVVARLSRRLRPPAYSAELIIFWTSLDFIQHCKYLARSLLARFLV